MRELVIRAQAGDHEAFSRLAEISIDDLYRTAHLILHDDDRTQDAVQDALILAWRDLRALRDPDRFSAWMRRLLVRSCYRVARRERGRAVHETELLPDDGPAITDAAAHLAVRDQLERGFRRLPADQRAVLVLRHYLGMPEAEAAEILDVPVGTVKSRLNRAVISLRAAIDADDRGGLLTRGHVA